MKTKDWVRCEYQYKIYECLLRVLKVSIPYSDWISLIFEFLSQFDSPNFHTGLGITRPAAALFPGGVWWGHFALSLCGEPSRTAAAGKGVVQSHLPSSQPSWGQCMRKLCASIEGHLFNGLSVFAEWDFWLHVEGTALWPYSWPQNRFHALWHKHKGEIGLLLRMPLFFGWFHFSGWNGFLPRIICGATNSLSWGALQMMVLPSSLLSSMEKMDAAKAGWVTDLLKMPESLNDFSFWACVFPSLLEIQLLSFQPEFPLCKLLNKKLPSLP